MLKDKKYKKLVILPILIGIFGLTPYLMFFINNFINFYSSNYLLNLVLKYSTLILTFMGAIYWGIGLNKLQSNISTRSKENRLMFIFSLIPFFFGLSFFVFEDKLGILLLIIGFIFCQTIDEYIYYKKVIMKWYLNLRRILSMIVVSNLIYCYIKIF